MNLNNEEGKDNQKLFRAQKLALYWLLGLIYSGFIGLQLGRIQAIADFNYSLHEILYVPFNLAIFLVPVVFLIYLYHVIKYLRKRRRQKGNLKTKVKAIMVIISIIFIFSITNHQFHEVSTGGIFVLKQKLHEEGKYYLVFDDKKISVSVNEFQLVEVNQQYLVSFVWNSRSPNKGRLKTIEPFK
ncbi:hypothetical protein BGM26_07790 [Bacillus sp. FJAT-29790]|uniref:hypothetical protein n=1 Tax=Bacillus sp. FJAT-29790 TaxID=1895002 RepID=UPI001C24ECAD|nr:hypothetical protein [Bacillus sp. FJAT-29790]MBU8878885.1 hypothetical protein [Bacillus sp. FJAT-29790]